MGEDLTGIIKIGGEGADKGNAGVRERGEGFVGFEDLGMDLFELEWGIKGVENLGLEGMFGKRV